MMESWVDKDEAFFDKPGQSKIRIKTTSAFDTQYSNIPPFHFSKGRQKWTPTLRVKSQPGLLDSDSLLLAPRLIIAKRFFR
jgi:hypothetical protein